MTVKPAKQAESSQDGNHTAPEQQAVSAKRKAPKRNRSIKRRPEDVPGLIVALKEDTIDLRTREAQDVLALRDSLAKDPEPVVKGLIRDALAIDGVIMSRIAAELVKPGNVILDGKGELNQLIAKHWPDVRGGILKSGRALLAVEKEGQPPATGEPDTMTDITSLIVAAQHGGMEARDNEQE